MRWGGVNDSNAMDAYEDHSGATYEPRLDRPSTWDDVLVTVTYARSRKTLAWGEPGSDPIADIEDFKRMIMETGPVTIGTAWYEGMTS